MPPDYSGVAVLTRENYIQVARELLAVCFEYYANTAAVPGDGVDKWGDWVTVAAMPSANIEPADYRGKCYVQLDRIVPFDSVTGVHTETPAGEDFVTSQRCAVLVTMTTHRDTYFLNEQLYPKIRDLLENRHGQLAMYGLRRFVITRTWLPTQERENPHDFVTAFILDFEVTFMVVARRS